MKQVCRVQIRMIGYGWVKENMPNVSSVEREVFIQWLDFSRQSRKRDSQGTSGNPAKLYKYVSI